MDISYKQAQELINDEYLLPSLLNLFSFLKEERKHINWIGLYLYKDNRLVLGPYAGKPACSILNLEKGVCALSFNKQKIINVKDVSLFPGHIYCDNNSKSELVLPLKNKLGVLDIDSDILNRFQEEDISFYKAILKLINERL